MSSNVTLYNVPQSEINVLLTFVKFVIRAEIIGFLVTMHLL